MASCGQRSTLRILQTDAPCDIRCEVKRRNGSDQWVCLTHGHLAISDGGGPLPQCAAAGIPAVPEDDILVFDLADYPGGVGIWGACRPALQIGAPPIERGVHVHARVEPDGPKIIDRSYEIVVVRDGDRSITIDADSALAYVASAVAGHTIVALTCPHCGHVHLDRDEFAVTPHRKHLCNRCHRNFWNPQPTVSNPLGELERWMHLPRPRTVTAPARHLELDRAVFGAIALWGTNPPILWTADRPQHDGLHVHAWDHDGHQLIDATYATVQLDGEDIDAELARLAMVQRILFADDQLRALRCPACDSELVDHGEDALHLHNQRRCPACDTTSISPGRRNVVSNPLHDRYQP